MAKNSPQLTSFARKYIAFSQKFRWPLLLVALVLASFSLFYTKDHLRLNKDLAALLPEHTPSVMALNESNQRFGSTDRFMIALQSSSPQLVARMQDSIKAHIDREWKDLAISSQIANDNSFFEKHALLYLPPEHLERIRDNLITIKRRMGSKGPLTVNLLEEEENEDEELVWFDADLPQELGLPDEAADSFKKFMSVDEKKSDKSASKEFNPKTNVPDSLKTRLIGQSKEDMLFNGVVIAKLIEPSTNMNFSEIVLHRSSALLEHFRAQSYDAPIKFSVEGTYEGLKDVDDMKTDGIISTAISVALILFLLFFFFKSFKAAVILVAQVSFACILMLGFTAIVYGQLNLFTLFVGAIIMGMGIDYSIHYIGTAQRELTESGGDLDEALIGTTVHLFRPMLLAALTTVAGLLTLLVADFRGFYEFGVIASAGILFSIASALLGLPVLISILGGLPENRTRSLLPASWSDQKIGLFTNRMAKGLVVLSLLLLPFLYFAEFEHNMRNLRADTKQDKKGSGIHTSVALSSNRKSSQPVAVFGDDKKELKALHDSLSYRLNVEKDPYLRSFLTLYTFVPDEDEQEERMELIEEISDEIRSSAFDQVDSANRKLVDQLREMVKVEPFVAKDIPEWALALLKEKDGSYGKIGFIYGSFESWNARDVAKFQDKYGHWNFGGKDLRAFSSSFIFSDVIRAVKRDSSSMAILIILVIMATLALSLRNLRAVTVCAISLGLGVLLTVEFMGVFNALFGIGKVGVFNVIVIPTLLGVGIDSTIHLLSSFQMGTRRLRDLIDTTGRMVIASSLTTGAGFFGVLFVSHKGMRTIGELAVLGICCTLIAALFITPWLSHKFLNKDS